MLNNTHRHQGPAQTVPKNPEKSRYGIYDANINLTLEECKNYFEQKVQNAIKTHSLKDLQTLLEELMKLQDLCKHEKNLLNLAYSARDLKNLLQNLEQHFNIRTSVFNPNHYEQGVQYPATFFLDRLLNDTKEIINKSTLKVSNAISEIPVIKTLESYKNTLEKSYKENNSPEEMELLLKQYKQDQRQIDEILRSRKNTKFPEFRENAYNLLETMGIKGIKEQKDYPVNRVLTSVECALALAVLEIEANLKKQKNPALGNEITRS